MDSLFSWVEFIARTAFYCTLMIGFIATIHEFGHFIIAKACGVRVDEFALGAGPALFSRKIGETEYNLRAIPILAYVRPAGMDPDEEFEPGDDPGERSYQAKGFWAKQAILIGGSLFNFIGAIGIYTMVHWTQGYPVTTILVSSLAADQPAASAGLLAGDILRTLDGTPIKDASEGVSYIASRPEKAIEIEFARAHKKKEMAGDLLEHPELYEVIKLTVTPALHSSGVGRIGIGVESWVLTDQPATPMAFVEALKVATGQIKAGALQLFKAMSAMLKNALFKFEVSKDVGGPVQIFSIISKQSKYGAKPMVLMTAQLSVSIGVFNLMPIPALDGGRMFLLLIATLVGFIDRLRGKEPGENKTMASIEEWIHVIGFFFLIGLMILVTFKDLRTVIGGWWYGPSPPAATAPVSPEGNPSATPEGTTPATSPEAPPKP